MIGLRSLAAVAAMIVSLIAATSAQAGHGSRHGGGHMGGGHMGGHGGYHGGHGARMVHAGPARVANIRVVRSHAHASAYVARPYIPQHYAVKPVRYVQAVRYQPTVYHQATYASYAGGGCKRSSRHCVCD